MYFGCAEREARAFTHTDSDYGWLYSDFESVLEGGFMFRWGQEGGGWVGRLVE